VAAIIELLYAVLTYEVLSILINNVRIRPFLPRDATR